MTSPTPTLTDSEQREILRNPEALAILLDYHDLQQDQADSMDAGCYGNELRHEELRQHGAKIIEADPEIWPPGLRQRFMEPTGYAAQRLAQARGKAAAGFAAPPILVANEAAPAAAAEGWKLVPVEPTVEMTRAATHWLKNLALMRAGDRTNAINDAYRAMLAAAPKESQS